MEILDFGFWVLEHMGVRWRMEGSWKMEDGGWNMED
jgi:hypothetical protein